MSAFACGASTHHHWSVAADFDFQGLRIGFTPFVDGDGEQSARHATRPSFCGRRDEQKTKHHRDLSVVNRAESTADRENVLFQAKNST
jgi:hypothetical protein